MKAIRLAWTVRPTLEEVLPMTRTAPVRTGPARPGLARAAVLAIATAAPLASGLFTAGAASADPPASVVAGLPPTSQAMLHAAVMTGPLGRKLK